MATVPSNQQWKKENTVMVGVRLMKKTDMDIINALQTEGTKQERLRDLLRKGIAYEQQGGTAPAPAQDPAPAAPAPDKEFQRLARVGAEYEDMLRRGWRMVEPEKKEDEPISKSVQDAISKLKRVMEERRAREAQQSTQQAENAEKTE